MLQVPAYTCKHIKYPLEKIDMWSLGCIVAELIMGYPLFIGNDEYACLHRIVDVLKPALEHEYIMRGYAWEKFFYVDDEGNLHLKTKEMYEEVLFVSISGIQHFS